VSFVDPTVAETAQIASRFSDPPPTLDGRVLMLGRAKPAFDPRQPTVVQKLDSQALIGLDNYPSAPQGVKVQGLVVKDHELEVVGNQDHELEAILGGSSGVGIGMAGAGDDGIGTEMRISADDDMQDGTTDDVGSTDGDPPWGWNDCDWEELEDEVATSNVPVSDLDVAQVGTLLDGLLLGKYKAAFAEAPVDGKTLVHCEDADLLELGISFKPHRRKLLDEVSQFVLGGVARRMLTLPGNGS
jgi:hypothetical protein